MAVFQQLHLIHLAWNHPCVRGWFLFYQLSSFGHVKRPQYLYRVWWSKTAYSAYIDRQSSKVHPVSQQKAQMSRWKLPYHTIWSSHLWHDGVFWDKGIWCWCGWPFNSDYGGCFESKYSHFPKQQGENTMTWVQQRKLLQRCFCQIQPWSTFLRI